MRLVVISIDPARFEKMLEVYPDAELFPGVSGCLDKLRRFRCIPQTYHNLALKAIEEGWGSETVVMQDDVKVKLTDEDGELVIYGQSFYRRDGSVRHVCPKAFRASPEIWLRLVEAWDGHTQACSGWMGIVGQWGKVLDVTSPIDG